MDMSGAGMSVAVVPLSTWVLGMECILSSMPYVDKTTLASMLPSRSYGVQLSMTEFRLSGPDPTAAITTYARGGRPATLVRKCHHSGLLVQEGLSLP